MALEAESSNLSRHPTKDRSGPFLYGLSFYDGPSPSGKAEDFDSSIRRFKSGRPNQRIPRMGDAVFYFAGVLQGLYRSGSYKKGRSFVRNCVLFCRVKSGELRV